MASDTASACRLSGVVGARESGRFFDVVLTHIGFSGRRDAGLTSAILLSRSLVMWLLGRQGVIAMERLTGMLFVMVAVQMFLDGVAAYLKTPA